MKSYKKVLLFMMVYFIILQFTIENVIDKSSIYNFRMNYDLIKDKPEYLDLVLKNLGKEIKRKKLENYIVILGDSVAFSSPGPAEKSIGYYIEKDLKQKDKNISIFNLALPSNQVGDIYTILLKMDEYGISRENVVIDVIYSGFIERYPDPAPVFWFGNELRKIDNESFQYVRNNLLINEKVSLDDEKLGLESIKKSILGNISIFKYKEAIEMDILIKLGRHNPEWISEEGQPWYEKNFLKAALEEPIYKREFSDKKIDLTENNYQIYFFNKIVQLQEGKNTLYFLAGSNKELMKEKTNKKGYIDNVKLIDDYFNNKNVQYINLMDKIDYNLFSDHIHLMPQGYEELSGQLVELLESWF